MNRVSDERLNYFRLWPDTSRETVKEEEQQSMAAELRLGRDLYKACLEIQKQPGEAKDITVDQWLGFLMALNSYKTEFSERE